MGQGTTGVDEAAPEKAEHEVEEIRNRLTGIARELDRRRHAALDVRGQLRRHAPAVGITAGALVLLVGGSIWLGHWRKARRARALSKARRLRVALSRMIAHPDDVARARPTVGKKALSAIVAAIAGVLAKTLAQRLVARTRPAARPN